MKEQDIGFGNKILGFDSPEEMLDYLTQRNAQAEAAMENLAEPQKKVGWGSYAVRVVAYDSDEALAIFGYIYTEAEFEASEIEAGAGIEDGELDAIMHRFRVNHEAGYRYGTWYSVICPQGEPGDAFVGDLWPITEADYHHVKNNRWEMPQFLQTRLLDEINEIRKELNE